MSGPRCAWYECPYPAGRSGYCAEHDEQNRMIWNGTLDKSVHVRWANAGRSCVVVDCDRPAKARGWCLRHHRRWWLYGHPLDGAEPAPGG